MSTDQQRKLGQKLAHAAEEVKLKHSPPLASKHARSAAKPNGTPLLPKNDSPKVNQKPTQQLGSAHQRTLIPTKPNPPQLPGGVKPSVPLLPKANSPGTKVKERAVKDGGESPEISEAEKANARNILDGVLKGRSPESPRPKGSPGGVAKKPLPPLKPMATRGQARDDRTKSVNLSEKGHEGQLHGSPSDDKECSLSQERSKVTRSLLLDSSKSGVNNEESCVVNSGTCKLPSASQSNDSRTKGNNDVPWRQGGINKSQRQGVVSLTEGVPRKPLPPPKKPAHLMSPERKSGHLTTPKRNSSQLTSSERNSLKSRSTTDLTENGKSVPTAVPPGRLAHTPQPVRAKLSMGGVKPSETKLNADGPKPWVKPTVSGAKPSLPGAKPKPVTPAKLTSDTGTKPKPPAVPTGTKPKPAGAKPKLPPGDKPTIAHKPTIASKPSTAMPDRRAPPPVPKVTDKGQESPKQRPTPPSKPRPISGLRGSHFGQPVAEKCPLEPAQDAKGALCSVTKDLRSSSEADASQTELDKTLTLTVSGEEQGAGKEVELENTVVVVEERSEDWVVVVSPTDSKPPLTLEEIMSPKKPLPMTPKSASKEIGENGHSPNKPLPSPPSRRGKNTPKPLQMLGAGSESKVESAANVLSRYPPPVSVEADPPRSPGFHGECLAKPPTPSGSPQIRISPSSFSKTVPDRNQRLVRLRAQIHRAQQRRDLLPKGSVKHDTVSRGLLKEGVSNEQGQDSKEGGEGRDTSSRGNVDSGFLSEVPDDLGLLRGASVESLGSGTSEERGGVTSPTLLTPDEERVEVVEPEVWDEARVEKARKKRLNIATELLTTEKTYSNRIKVIAVDFYDVVQHYNSKSKQSIPDSAVQQIFLNLKQIHQLSENILHELQQRMDMWSSNEALGDVICRLAPFLKLYAHYTSGFEDAVKMLTECTKRDRKFDAVVREFERSSVSTGMGVASFMLEPVSRIPRYRLLLLDYLKYLPPDSPDRPHTESALRIISEAADHSNDRIKELENSNTILTIQRSLVDYDSTLLAPYRSFLKKGTLLKSSRKALSPRFFFLFSDILLHTYPSEKDVYRFRNEMPIFGMKVEDPKVSLVPFSFNIYSTTRSLILVASCEEEKGEWISALQSAITEDMKKRSSLRRDAHLQITKASSLFGTKAPIMVPDKSVTMCQGCSSEFTMMFRRHHCRACGKVMCGNCSQQKAYLPYLRRIERVCMPCFVESKNPDRTSGDESVDGSPISSPVGPRKQDSTTSSNSVLNLRAYEDDAVIAGYVLCQEGKKWTKMWYQVKKDCVLYKFKAHEDIKAVNSMPLPGYAIGSDASQHTITLNHHSGMKNLCETFRVDDEVAFESWLNAIRKVIRMEFDIPLPSSHTIVTSPLTQSFSASSEHAPSSRPLSENSFIGSRPNSFVGSQPDSFTSSGSRPTSVREASPSLDQVGTS